MDLETDTREQYEALRQIEARAKSAYDSDVAATLTTKQCKALLRYIEQHGEDRYEEGRSYEDSGCY